MKKILLAIVLCFLFGTANAQFRCALKAGPTFLEEPAPTKAARPAKYLLIQGKSYLVLKQQPKWIQIQVESAHLWAARELFGASTNCPQTTPRKPASQKVNPNAKPPAIPKVAAPRDCPCGSARVCQGSRGGRYCVSTNGSRRYVR